MKAKNKLSGGSVTVCVNIKHRLYDAVRLMAFAEERTATEIINDTLADYCKRHAKKLAKLTEAQEQMRQAVEAEG